MITATFTVNEAAKYCKCHPETIREYIRSGRLIASKVGRAWIIRQSRLDEFLEQLENDAVQASLSRSESCQKMDSTNATAFGTWTSERQTVSALDALLAPKTNNKRKHYAPN